MFLYPLVRYFCSLLQKSECCLLNEISCTIECRASSSCNPHQSCEMPKDKDCQHTLVVLVLTQQLTQLCVAGMMIYSISTHGEGHEKHHPQSKLVTTSYFFFYSKVFYKYMRATDSLCSHTCKIRGFFALYLLTKCTARSRCPCKWYRFYKLQIRQHDLTLNHVMWHVLCCSSGWLKSGH